MKQSGSIEELSEALKQAEIPAWYMIEADDAFKRDHGLSAEEKWHRFFIETDFAPINQWENMPLYTKIAVNEALTEIKIIEK